MAETLEKHVADSLLDEMAERWPHGRFRHQHRSHNRLTLRRRRAIAQITVNISEMCIWVDLKKVKLRQEALIGHWEEDQLIEHAEFSLYDPKYFQRVEEFIDDFMLIPQYGDRGYRGC